MTSKFVYIGIILYGAAAAINVLALKDADYSVVLPLASITYIWTMLIAKFLLGEKISLRKIGGTALIIAGVCVVVGQ